MLLRTLSIDFSPSEFLLADPTGILANPDEVKGTITSNIFEAKRDNVRAALPQAVIAAASHCKQHKYDLFIFSYVQLIILFIVPKFTGNARLHYKRRTVGFLCLREKGRRQRTRLFLKRICYWATV